MKASDRLLKKRAFALRAAPRSRKQAKIVEVLYFHVAKEKYALRMLAVEAVHPFVDYTPVPGAPVHIRGVAHFAGEILSLLDLSLLFGIATRGISDLRRAIVVGKGPRRMAILATETDEIALINDAEILPPPGGRGPEREWAEGVIGADRLLLSLPRILDGLEAERERRRR